jgi:hypothetical protein
MVNNCDYEISRSHGGGAYRSTIFRDAMSCSLKKVYGRFGGSCRNACCLLGLFYCYLDGDNTFFRNVSKLLEE